MYLTPLKHVVKKNGKKEWRLCLHAKYMYTFVFGPTRKDIDSSCISKLKEEEWKSFPSKHTNILYNFRTKTDWCFCDCHHLFLVRIICTCIHICCAAIENIFVMTYTLNDLNCVEYIHMHIHLQFFPPFK